MTNLIDKATRVFRRTDKLIEVMDTASGTTTPVEPAPRKTAYERVTTNILELLDKGIVPWRKTWVTADSAPRNPISGISYRGSNILFLWVSMLKNSWTDPRFATFDQIKEAGGSVIRGSKGTHCIRWMSALSKKNFDSNGNPERYEFAKAFVVFNLAQQSDLELEPLVKAVREDAAPHAEAEFLVERSGAKIVEGAKPCYHLLTDTIEMPARESFESDVEFESTRFHELVHWTGAEGREARFAADESREAFKRESYAKEELVAEIGATFLMSEVGLDSDERCFENSVAYLQGWKSKLRDEPGLIVAAASAAQRAVDVLIERRDMRAAA